MYLKSLEIQGFKSFPDKTVLNFEDGIITAIVGPNGSGKSNIADAIRWVMGEQSTRNLRSGKMEDVIFGGTEKRSQVGFAEVSLIIDNSDRSLDIDHNEVIITRRYYRSGESEYYINRNSVRLKDINELFMDTGLGREGYSIIGQGRIDEILSQRSTDRREVFEEAAGISKYRHRKEEAERKLLSTEENLVRINDKISELSFTLGPLKEQAGKAKKYLLLRDELRQLEVNVSLDALEKLRQTSSKTAYDFNAISAQFENDQSALAGLYEKAEEFGRLMREKDLERDELQRELEKGEAASSDIEAAIAVIRNTIKLNTENIDRLNTELNEKKGRAGGIQEQRAAHETRISELDRLISELSGELAKKREEAASAAVLAGDVSVRIDALRAEAQSARFGASEARVLLASLEASEAELTSRKNDISSEIESCRESAEAIERGLNEDKASLSQAREQAENTSNIIEGYELRLQNRKKRAQNAAEKAVSLKNQLLAAQSRIAMLAEMEKEYEGYSGAVRFVMQQAERGGLRGIHGPVSSLIKTGDAYALAIETALGAAMQNIVVDTEEDGKRAINMLRDRGAGRATFLPISAIRGRMTEEKGLENAPGFVGIASELLEFDGKYRDIFLNLLGRTVVCDNIDSAISLARSKGYRFRIVTLDGQIINAGGSMTGGSTSKGTGVLSRRNELERLKAGKKAQEEQYTAAAKEQEEADRELAAALYALEVARDEKRVAESALSRLESEIVHKEELLRRERLTINALESELDAVVKRIDSDRERVKKLLAEIETLEKRAQELTGEAEALSGGHEELLKKNTELSDAISSLRERLASCEAERQGVISAVNELDRLSRELTSDNQSVESLLSEYDAKNAELEKNLEARELELAASRESCSAIREKIEKTVSERLALEESRVLAEKEAQEKNRTLLNVERERARLEQMMQKNALEEKQIIDRLWENYGLTHSAAEAMRTPLESVSKANRRIAELKKEISELGNPNIGAIDEYKRVNERYEYLAGQRDDVEKAKNDIQKIIADLTSQMKSIFTTQFEIINQKFRETFIEIFGGGTAALELDDPDDVLGCGIEIKAQPPGKQLKTITLLSGGEKAFVAIALYFAIIKVRPTPFCVLDEIEAALDDINVVSFAAYLRRLSVATQFIVITHRRGTMEEADALYGVTMQEQGVSKVLTLKLSEVERELNLKLS